MDIRQFRWLQLPFSWVADLARLPAPTALACAVLGLTTKRACVWRRQLATRLPHRGFVKHGFEAKDG